MSVDFLHSYNRDVITFYIHLIIFRKMKSVKENIISTNRKFFKQSHAMSVSFYRSKNFRPFRADNININLYIF